MLGKVLTILKVETILKTSAIPLQTYRRILGFKSR